MSSKSSFISRIFLFSLMALLNVFVKSVHSWPLMDNGVDANELQDSDQLRLLRELEQRRAVLKEEQAYNEHLENVIYEMALRDAKSTANEGNEDTTIDSGLLYRASRSHGKPTFIRFGKRAAPSFIRFGKRAMDEQAAPAFEEEKRQEKTKSKM